MIEPLASSSSIQADCEEPDSSDPDTSEPDTSEPVKHLRKGPFVKKGLKAAIFCNNNHWDAEANELVGSSTTALGFEDGCIITRAHLEDLFSGGSSVLQKLTYFAIKFDDVTYRAHNSAEDLTDAVVVRLARHCPRLRVCKLQGTSGLTSASPMAFFRHCPDLVHLDITPHLNRRNRFDGSLFEMLEGEPGLVPRLRTLRIGVRGRSHYKQDMLALSRARRKLTHQVAGALGVQEVGGLGAGKGRGDLPQGEEM